MRILNKSKGKPCTLAVLALAGLFAVFLIAACQELEGTPGLPITDNSAGNPPDTITDNSAVEATGLKLGAVLPYTGSLADVGQPMIEVLPLLIDQVNTCGGVNDQRVSLVVKDDLSQPNGAAAAMTNLAEAEGVDVAIVGFLNSTSRKALDIAVKNQILTISPATTSPVFTEWAKKKAFQGFWARTVPSDTYQARALARLAINRRFRRVSTLVVNNDDGISFEQSFVKAFEALGGTVMNKTDPTRYNPATDNFNYTALTAFSPDLDPPDAVVAALDPQGGPRLLSAAYNLELTEDTPILLAGNVQPRSLLETVGKAYTDKSILAGTLGAVPRASGPALNNLTELWKQQMGGTPGALVAHTWDAGALLLLAAQAANSNDGNVIKSQLQSVANPPGIEVTNICTGLKLLKSGQDIDYQGAGSNLDLDENGDVVGNYEVWMMNDEGEIEVVEQIRLD
jgi:neutral amino acid transport system substrate-binding protein